MKLRRSYIEACLKVVKSPTFKATSNLDSAFNSLIRGEGTVVDAGETEVTIILGLGTRTKVHFTEGLRQTVGRGRFSNGSMGRKGLGNMSDLGNRKIWDRVGLEGAYTAMSSFTLIVRDVSSGNATTASIDGCTSGLWRFHLTWSEACSSRREPRACPTASRRRNGERVMLTSALVRKKLRRRTDASFHLRCSAILTANCIILMSGSDTDFEATIRDVGNVFGRKRGQVSGRSVMMRRVSQRVRTASSHASASN
jgi:hypothetical protein